MDDNISQKRFSDVNQPLLCVKISQEILLKASFSKEQSIIETVKKNKISIQSQCVSNEASFSSFISVYF